MRKNKNNVACKEISPFPATSLHDGFQKTPQSICGSAVILIAPFGPSPLCDVLTNPWGTWSFLSSQKSPPYLQHSKQSKENRPLLKSHILLRHLCSHILSVNMWPKHFLWTLAENNDSIQEWKESAPFQVFLVRDNFHKTLLHSNWRKRLQKKTFGRELLFISFFFADKGQK